jgi:prolyl oligopeptidase
MRRELAVHVAEQRDLAAGKPRWHKLAGVEDEVLAIEGWKDDLYLLTKSGAPRHRILRAKGNAPNMAAARVAVPQGDVVIESMALAKDAIYMRMMNGGVDRLERVHLSSLGNLKSNEYLRTFDTAIAQLVTDPASRGNPQARGLDRAPSVMEVDAKRGELTRMSLQPPGRGAGRRPRRGASTPPPRRHACRHAALPQVHELTGQNPRCSSGMARSARRHPTFDPAA